MHPAFALAQHKLKDARSEFDMAVAIDDDIVPSLNARRDDVALTARSALQATIIEGVYTGIEGVLKELLAVMDGTVSSPADSWHAQLLAQAAAVTESRPAIISEVIYTALNQLRAFRHIERNVYRNALRPLDVSDNMTRLRTTFPQLEAEVQHFMATQKPPV